MRHLRHNLHWIFLMAAAVLPLIDAMLPLQYRFADNIRPIFIYAILGLGLNVLTGYTGLLNLGAAGFMALGAYTYAILSCDIYPFQVGFLGGLLGALVTGLLAGVILGLPTLRLRGDYIAIVTMGFGEIVQSLLRNLDVITKGTQGINPLPAPRIFGYAFPTETYQASYYLFLFILFLVVLICSNLEKSPVGRSWISIREDELASACMGTNPVRVKLLAFSFSAALCGLAGALWASYLGSSGEPGNYDFQVSIMALCIVIVGGLGNIAGVLLGALVMMGFNSILLVKLSEALARMGIESSGNIYLSPNNWKYAIFGLALILMMRYRPEGLLPAAQLQAELPHKATSGTA